MLLTAYLLGAIMKKNFYFVDSIQWAAAWLKQHEIEPLQCSTTYRNGILLHISYDEFIAIYDLNKPDIREYKGRDFTEYQAEHGEGLLVISCYKEAPYKRVK